MDMLENALHAAQLNLFLGQQAGQSARWVARAKTK